MSEPVKVNLPTRMPDRSSPALFTTRSIGDVSNAVPPPEKSHRISLPADQLEADTELPSPSSGRSSSMSLAEREGHEGVAVGALCPGLPQAPACPVDLAARAAALLALTAAADPRTASPPHSALSAKPINPFCAGGATLAGFAVAAPPGMGAMFGADAEGTDDPIVSTAVAMRNLPRACQREALIEEMKHAAFCEGRDFNLVVMPIDPCSGMSMGYCLVNFVTVGARNAFASAFHGRWLECTGTEAEIELVTVQDLQTAYCQLLAESPAPPAFRPMPGQPRFCSQCGHHHGLRAGFFCTNCGSAISSRQ